MRFLFLSLVAFAAADLVSTPFGYRLRQCVLEVESGARVSSVPNGVQVTLESNGVLQSSYVHPVPEECHHDGFVESLIEKRQSKPMTLPAAPLVPDGWLDYAGDYILGRGGNISSFNATYTVPGDPLTNSPQQDLYYFIGIQNNDSPPVNIIQPVLAWGYLGPGWSVSSWCCCPTNITVKSKSITGFGAGDQIQGNMYRVNSNTWVIDSIIRKTSANTTLQSQIGPYIYDWANVCLEVYSVNVCSQMAKGDAQFTNLVIRGPNGENLTPKWTLTGPTGCSGKIVMDSTGINISHSQS